MGVSTFDTLLASVKHGTLAPVYYLYGDEDVLKDEAIRAVCEAALDPAARDFNLDQRAAADTDAESLHTLTNTPPLLAQRRVVVLRNVGEMRRRSKARDELLRYLDKPNPSTVLVLVQGAGEKPEADLAGRGAAVQVDRLPPDRVGRWAAHRAGQLGLTLDPAAAALLVEAVGDDLGLLGRELEKLAGLAGDGPVSRDQVAGLLGVRHGATVYDLVDAALDREATRAARLVGPVLEQAGVTGVRAVTALGAALIGTALARAELDAGTPARRLPDVLFRHLLAARPYALRGWKDEAARWARWGARWAPAELARAIRRTLAADRALKTGTVSDDHGILTQLVLALTLPAREAA